MAANKQYNAYYLKCKLCGFVSIEDLDADILQSQENDIRKHLIVKHTDEIFTEFVEVNFKENL